MTKEELAESIHNKGYGESKAESKRIVDAVLDSMKDSLIAGEEVRLGGFGNFKVNRRNARDARNPQTGDTIKVPAKVVVKFKAAKHLAEAVDNKKLLKALA